MVPRLLDFFCPLFRKVCAGKVGYFEFLCFANISPCLSPAKKRKELFDEEKFLLVCVE